jgi:curved DNA-binding protein CbpA
MACNMTRRDAHHTYYKTMMLAENADREIISTVYRKLARRYHPDLDSSPEAASRMLELNEAYDTLRDREKRREYDAWLASRRDRRKNDRLTVEPGDVPYGTAGMPVGPATGSVLDFGRYRGWTLGQIRRQDPSFLEWLLRVPIGRQYRDEITQILASR